MEYPYGVLCFIAGMVMTIPMYYLVHKAAVKRTIIVAALLYESLEHMRKFMDYCYPYGKWKYADFHGDILKEATEPMRKFVAKTIQINLEEAKETK